MKMPLSPRDIAILLNDEFGNTYNGFSKMDEDHSIGVELAEQRVRPDTCIGGDDCTLFGMLPINISVRWSKSFEETYQKACDVMSYLSGVSKLTLKSGFRIECIIPTDGIPISIGKTNDISEFIVRVNVHYKFKED